MNIFEKNDLHLSQEELQKFEQLFKLFTDWNHQINLSAIRAKDDIYLKHFVDSLLATKFFDFDNKPILDLGSGGGFPALPLSIMFPNSPILAVDSIGKKMKAVQSIADEMGLRIKTQNQRIETLGHRSGFRDNFDLVIARALAPWPVLLEYALPFVKVGGHFVAYQGPSVMDDLETYTNLEVRLGGEIQQINAASLEGNERIFVVIEKKKKTPKKYPRAIGEPKSNPLK